MNATSNVERFSGFYGPPMDGATHYYVDRFVLNAVLSELPGIAIAVVTACYLVSMFFSMM